MTVNAMKVGAWAWIVTGAGHLSLQAVIALRPKSPAATRAVEAMRDYAFSIGGIERDLEQVNLGMSLVMGAALVVSGSLMVYVVRHAPAPAVRSLAVPAAAASALVLAVAAWLLPTPPIVLFTVATAAFTVAAVKARAAVRTKAAA